MLTIIEQLAETGKGVAEACGVNYSLRILGEGSRQSLVIGDQAIISRDPGTDSWRVNIYPQLLSMIQLRAMFGIEGGETLPSELVPAETSIDALNRVFSALFRLRLNGFVEQYNQTKQEGALAVVAKVPNEVTRVEDGAVLRDRALALCGISAFEALPPGAQRWLSTFDWEGARAVYNLRSEYRLSAEDGRTFNGFGDYYRYYGTLAKPYDRADKVSILAYSRGIAIQRYGKYELFFFKFGATTTVIHLRVGEDEFPKNFAFDLDDSLTVDVSLDGEHNCYIGKSSRNRKVKLSRLLKAEETPFESGILSRECLEIFADRERVSIRADVDATALNSSARLMFVRFNGVRYFANIRQVSESLTPESTEIVIRRCETDHTVEVKIPIMVEPHPTAKGKYTVAAADQEFEFLVDSLNLWVPKQKELGALPQTAVA